MPATKKEGFYFGLMMCLGMVIFMSFYNLYTNGLFGTVTVTEILFQLVLCFIVAASLEIVIVGPIAKKIAFALPYDKSKKIFAVV